MRALPVAALCVAMVSQSAPALALDVHVMQLRVAGTRLWAAIELRDLLRDKFLDRKSVV